MMEGAAVTGKSPPKSTAFSRTQRDFIVKHDWDFISTYMSPQASWELQAYNISYFELMEHASDNTLFREFLPAWRLRFLLYYFRSLRNIVDRILREISLGVEPVDAVYRGEIRGKLNMTAYWQSRSQSTSIPAFPCRVTRLDYSTEENQLLVFTLLKMREQLRTVVPHEALGGSERREIQYNLDYISSVLHQAYFEQVITDVWTYLRLDAMPPTLDNFYPILERIRQKCERRITTNAYAELVDWFQRFYLKQGVQPVESDSDAPILHALYYGEQFDNTLYELWLLARIVKTIQSRYGFTIRDPQPFYRVTATRLAEKASWAEPVCTLVSPGGLQLQVFYRKGSGVLWDSSSEELPSHPYWTDLRGIPDLTLVRGKEDGRCARLILDAKNRHWGAEETPPSEEVYKMVGYLSNFRRSEIRAGALIFRSDTEPKSYLYQTADGAEILAAYSVSPSEDAVVCQYQVDQLSEFILDHLGFLAHRLTLASQYARRTYQAAIASSPKGSREVMLEEKFLVPLYRFCDHLAVQRAQDVGRHVDLLRAEHLHDFVDRMSPEGQQYLATAEMLYREMDPTSNYDYAAALIGYTRCMEKEVNYQLLMPFKRDALVQGIDFSPSANLSMPTREPTLGGIVTELKRCIEPTHATIPVYAALRQWIKDHASNANYLLNKFPNLLDRFNTDYRQGAAHTDQVTFHMLQACRHLVLGIGWKDRLLFDFMYSLKP